MEIDSLKVIRVGNPSLSVTDFKTIAAAAQAGRAATAQVLILHSLGIERFYPELLLYTQLIRP